MLDYLKELLQYAQNFGAALALSEDATLQLIVVLLPPIRDDEFLLGLVREACGDSEARTAIRKSIMQSVVPGTEVTSAIMEYAVLEAFQEVNIRVYLFESLNIDLVLGYRWPKSHLLRNRPLLFIGFFAPP